MKKGIFLLAFVFFTLLFIPGCGKTQTEEDKIIAQGYKNIVTFDANGGAFGEYEKRYRYLKDNSLLAAPGSLGIDEPIKSLYSLEGWYKAELDEDGMPKLDENDEVVLENTPFDFSNTRINDSFTLYAKWQRNYYYELVYVGYNVKTNESIPIEDIVFDEDGKEQKIQKVEYKKASEGVKLQEVSDITKLSVSGFTAIQYYQDAECTIPWDENYTHAGDSENPDVLVYTLCYQGSFILADEANDLVNFNGESNVYLLNDLDFTGYTWNSIQQYLGCFCGNGYTIKNVTVSLTDSNLFFIGLFGSLMDAKIENVTFENCKFEIAYTQETINQTVRQIGFLAAMVENSTLTNITMSHCSIEVSIQNEANVSTDYTEPYYYNYIDTNSVVTNVKGTIEIINS